MEGVKASNVLFICILIAIRYYKYSVGHSRQFYVRTTHFPNMFQDPLGINDVCLDDLREMSCEKEK